MANSSGSSFWFAPHPIFDGNDYDIWQKKMKTFFISQRLWNLVQKGEVNDEKEEEKDAQALYYIQQAVTPTIFYKFISASSAKTAWDFLEAEYNNQTFLEDIDFHAIEIHENLDIPIWIHSKIREVRRDLRDLNPAVYTPELISIGPLHHGRPELANMEKQKLHYAKCFLNTTGKQKDLFVVYIKQHEKIIRDCYYIYSDLSSKDYVEMILLDSFFIFEFFLRGLVPDSIGGDSLVHDEVTLRKNILVDLMLFENQLPLNLLYELYKIAFEDSFDGLLFYTCNLSFFPSTVPVSEHVPEPVYRFLNAQMDKQLHLTNLVRRYKCCKMQETQMKEPKRIQILKYGARELSKSNVEFSGLLYGSLDDIKFKKRVLVLPLLTVDNTTERVYGNLIGLEQCDEFKEEAYISSYILLLGFLITNSDDVAVLVEDGVILNELGSNQAVVDMLHRLGKGILLNIPFLKVYFSDVCVELNHYCSSWKGWGNYCRKLLKDGYFSDIWKGTATVVAVILLLLTLTQTITSIMQVM